MCVLCVGFFKFAQRFFKKRLFFFKTNFNLKLPYTHYTHLYSPRVSSLFTLSNCTHICTHTVHTWGSSVHTCSTEHVPQPLMSTNREPRAVFHDLVPRSRVESYLCPWGL